MILDIRQHGEAGHDLIIRELENTIDELRLSRDEIHTYKAQIKDF